MAEVSPVTGTLVLQTHGAVRAHGRTRSAAVPAVRAEDRDQDPAVVIHDTRDARNSQPLAQRSAAAGEKINALLGAGVQRVEAGAQQVGIAGPANERGGSARSESHHQPIPDS